MYYDDDDDDENDSGNDGVEELTRLKGKMLLGKHPNGKCFPPAKLLISQVCKHKSITSTFTILLQLLMVRPVRRERVIQEMAAKSKSV